jgi:hypothetical protein
MNISYWGKYFFIKEISIRLLRKKEKSSEGFISFSKEKDRKLSTRVSSLRYANTLKLIKINKHEIKLFRPLVKPRYLFF